MNRSIVFSLGIGLITMGIVRGFYEIPSVVLFSVALYTVLFSSGQYFTSSTKLKHALSKRSIRLSKGIGTGIIIGSISVTIILAAYLYHLKGGELSKEADIFTFIAVGVSFITVGVYESESKSIAFSKSRPITPYLHTGTDVSRNFQGDFKDTLKSISLLVLTFVFVILLYFTILSNSDIDIYEFGKGLATFNITFSIGLGTLLVGSINILKRDQLQEMKGRIKFYLTQFVGLFVINLLVLMSSFTNMPCILKVFLLGALLSDVVIIWDTRRLFKVVYSKAIH